MRWKMIIGGFGVTTRREGPMRNSNLRLRVLSLALLACVACVAPPFAGAGLAQTSAAQPFPDGAPFTMALDSTVKLNADKTGEYLETRRVKVLGISALQQVAQQSAEYVEGMQSFEIVSAFTEKGNGTRLPVDLATVITRDVATGLGAVLLRDFLVNIDADCSSTAFASVRMVEEPKHGAATLKDDTGFTNFAKDNSRFECNKQRSGGTAVLYRGEEGYTGNDSVTVEIVYVDGRETSVHYSIDVK
jgi:hypothetical protein